MNELFAVPEAPPRLPLAHEADFSLGTMRVRPSLCEVAFGGEAHHLEPRVMQVLVSLARARGAVLTRDDLVDCCWGGVIVGDDAINRVIGKLRRLAEHKGPSFVIETLPRVGYRLLADERSGAGSVPDVDVPSLEPRPSWNGGHPLIAVLPFDDAIADEDQAFLAEGLVCRILDALKCSSWLSIISRQSPSSERSEPFDARRVSKQLGVQYLVCGHLRFNESTLRVAIKLIDGRDDDLVWSGRYQRSLEPKLEEDREIAAQVVGSVESALLRREQERALQTSSSTLQHWDLFMRGRWHIWRSTRRSNALGQNLLAEALTLKPDDVPTMSLLVFAKVAAIWAGWVDDPVASRLEAERLALKAVAIDPSNAFAHFASGAVLALSDKLERAIAEQRRALELNPHFDLAAGELGRLLAFSGRTREAEAFTAWAIVASPKSPHIALWTRDRAVGCFIDGRYDEAAAYAFEACAKRPNWFLLHYFCAACLAAADRPEQAREALAAGRSLMTPYPFELLKAAHPFVDPEHMARFLTALRGAGWDD